jgi:hypothetical protein
MSLSRLRGRGSFVLVVVDGGEEVPFWGACMAMPMPIPRVDSRTYGS